MKIILVVEDDLVTRKIVTNAIKKRGFNVIASPHGKHAYETLKSNEGIELVITDISMPEMDGRQLIQIIRTDSELSSIPIIAMSGVVGPNEISGILELGANLFMGKPLEIEELYENIARCIEEEVVPA